jgi:SAM-dependent methyltransferase
VLDTKRFFNKFYYDVPSFVDGTSEFHSLCGRYIQPGSRTLEIGPGPANPTSRFLASIGPVAGVDISDELSTNRWLSEAYVYDGRHLPFPDGTFAACVSDYVLEHIEDPDQHFREVARALRPGGIYCFRTPNRWHYVALAASILPHSVQLRMANRLRCLPKNAHDPYRTLYRTNTPRAIRQVCVRAGLRVVEIRLVEKEPSYGRVHAALFLSMMLYERVVNSLESLGRIRANIYAAIVKPMSNPPV